MELKINMPDLNSRTGKSVLASWTKNVGDAVQKGDIIFEVETDKVVSEIEATEDGIIREVYFESGDEVAAGTAVALLQI